MLLLLTRSSSKYQIWTMKPDGTEQRKLVEGEHGITFHSARWSPNGDAIYYFREEGDTVEIVRLPASGQSVGSSVLVSGIETGDVRRARCEGNEHYFTLTAGGSQLAYTRTQSYSNLWLIELPQKGASAEAQKRPLTSGTSSYSYPSFSPDGRWVAFTIDSDKSNVYKMASDGGQPVQLTFFDAALTSSPAWSPDGRRIAFVSDQGGTPKIWVVNADGGNARPLDKTDTSDSNYELAWSPRPEIVYQPPGIHNLRRLNVETQEERPLLPMDSKGWLITKPIYSLDGKKIAIDWNQSPADGVWITTLEKSSERLLYALAWPLGWSSDGNFIYAVEDANPRAVLKIGLGDPKRPKSVTTMPGDIKWGAVSPDGRRMIVSVGEEKSDVWVMKNFDPQVVRAQY
jgi:Tol biopolymer transport system component